MKVLSMFIFKKWFLTLCNIKQSINKWYYIGIEHHYHSQIYANIQYRVTWIFIWHVNAAFEAKRLYTQGSEKVIQKTTSATIKIKFY